MAGKWKASLGKRPPTAMAYKLNVPASHPDCPRCAALRVRYQPAPKLPWLDILHITPEQLMDQIEETLRKAYLP